MNNNQSIYLAGGCFWGVEGYFSQLKGVVSTSVGYANGLTEETNYNQLKETDHAETIHIQYDSKQISLQEILKHYFRIVDPTSLNKQGNDVGRQYRTGIYFVEKNDLTVIEQELKTLEAQINQSVVIELEPLKNYVLAEEYHQDYLKKNPNGYCHVDISLAQVPLS